MNSQFNDIDQEFITLDSAEQWSALTKMLKDRSIAKHVQNTTLSNTKWQESWNKKLQEVRQHLFTSSMSILLFAILIYFIGYKNLKEIQNLNYSHHDIKILAAELITIASFLGIIVAYINLIRHFINYYRLEYSNILIKAICQFQVIKKDTNSVYEIYNSLLPKTDLTLLKNFENPYKGEQISEDDRIKSLINKLKK